LVNILFISYEFPPLKKGGVFRPLGFCESLVSSKYNPVVITVSKDCWQREGQNLDFGLGVETRKKLDIIEIQKNSNLLSSKSSIQQKITLFFSPNGREKLSWQKQFRLKIPEIIAIHQPKVIFVTAPPFSIIDLAINIKREFNIPLVIDLRDAWSNWFTAPYHSFFHYTWVRRKESKALRLADKIITTSKQTEKDLKKLNSYVDKKKFVYIPNGYDGNLSKWNVLSKKNKIVVGYVGSFYYSPEQRQNMVSSWWERKGYRKLSYIPNKQDWLYRSPYFFFKMLSQLISNEPDYKNIIQIKFAGRKEKWFDDMVKKFKLESLVKHIGLLNHQDSMAFQGKCDALFLTSSKVINGRDYSIAGKTFEYIKNLKPIIACTSEGAQTDLLMKTGVAIHLNPDDISNGVEKLKKLLDGQIKLTPNYKFINSLSRFNCTLKLIDIFDDILKK